MNFCNLYPIRHRSVQYRTATLLSMRNYYLMFLLLMLNQVKPSQCDTFYTHTHTPLHCCAFVYFGRGHKKRQQLYCHLLLPHNIAHNFQPTCPGSGASLPRPTKVSDRARSARKRRGSPPVVRRR